MDFLPKYTLGDFSDFANRHIDSGFEEISSPDFCVWEYKYFADNDGRETGGYMVLVGNYFYGSGMQSVWARATGLEVNYYHGTRYDTKVMQVEDRFRYRIYFIDPFCHIAGPQNKGVNKERQHGQVNTEAVINYLFLSQGYLALVNGIGSSNMLEDFKLACINFELRKKEKERADYAKWLQAEINEEDQAPAREYEQRKRAGEFAMPYMREHKRAGGVNMPDIKQENMDDDNDDELRWPRSYGAFGKNKFDFPHTKHSHPARRDPNKKSDSSDRFRTKYGNGTKVGVSKSFPWKDTKVRPELQRFQNSLSKNPPIKLEHDNTSSYLNRVEVKSNKNGKYNFNDGWMW